MLGLDAVRALVAVAGTSAATYFDIFNNRNVPDELSYGFVAVAALFALLTAGSGLAYVLAVAGVVFAVGWVLYRAGQIGGADVFVFVALSLLLQNEGGMPAIVSVFFLSGIFFGIHMFARFAPRVAGALLMGEIRMSRAEKTMAAALVLAYAAWAYVIYSLGVEWQFAGLASLLLLFSVFFSIFRKYIAENFLVEVVPLSGVEAEDVLAVEMMDEKAVRKFGFGKLVDARMLERMKKSRVKKFPVYKKLPPFMPYVLIALLLTLAYGNVFWFIGGIVYSK